MASEASNLQMRRPGAGADRATSLTRNNRSPSLRGPPGATRGDEAIQGLRDAAPKLAGVARRPLDCFPLAALGVAMTEYVGITLRLRASVSSEGTGRGRRRTNKKVGRLGVVKLQKKAPDVGI